MTPIRSIPTSPRMPGPNCSSPRTIRARPRPVLLGALLAVTALGSGGAQAQLGPGPGVINTTPIDPGRVLREDLRNQRQLEQRGGGIVGPPVVAPSGQTAIPPPGGPTVTLRSVRFDASKFLTPEELEAIAARYRGQAVDISQIQRLVKEVNDLYVAKGIVTASAFLPPQDLKGGDLQVRLVEGRFGAAEVKGLVQLSPDFVLERLNPEPGEVIDPARLTDDVARFNKTGFAQVQAFLQPGAQFGLTNIVYSVLEPPTNALDLFVDNYGVRSVGAFERGFLFQRYAPLGIDDKLTVYGIQANGNVSGSLAYNLPFNTTGGRIGLSYSQGAIRIINGPYRALDITGESRIGAVNLVQPLFVDPNWSLLFTGAISVNTSISDQDTVRITDNLTRKGTAGLSLGYVDEGGAVNVSATYSRAHTDFGVVDRKGEYDLYNFAYSGLLRLPESFYATATGAAQIASTYLLPGDQLFQIGGPLSIRGLTTALAAGSSGYFANFQINRPLDFIDPGLGAFAFFDTGSVYNASPKVISLNAAGAGLSWNARNAFIADVGVGFPLRNTTTLRQPDYTVFFRLTARAY